MSRRIVRGETEAPIEPLFGKTVAVIGYGNQGAAHALNLRDSGVNVIVANRRESANGRRALEAGFEPQPVAEAVAAADLLIIALPDEVQAQVYAREIAPNVKSGAVAGFLHGFSLHYEHVQPAEDVGVILLAPKGPGTTLRERYSQGLGIPALFAVHQDSPKGDAEAIGLAWARGIGCARAAIVYTTVKDETETDLFGEQAVLCGGMTWLMLAAFETLVQAGYPPELAYLECCHEVKQVADLVYEGGPVAMMDAISNTAEFGAHVAGPIVVDEALRDRLKQLLEAIRSGQFADRFQGDAAGGFRWLAEQRQRFAQHPIEQASETVRGLMPRPDGVPAERQTGEGG